jgi:hypothetical protein
VNRPGRAMMLIDGAELVLRFTSPVDELRLDAATARKFAALLSDFAVQLEMRCAPAELDRAAMTIKQEQPS